MSWGSVLTAEGHVQTSNVKFHFFKGKKQPRSVPSLKLSGGLATAVRFLVGVEEETREKLRSLLADVPAVMRPELERHLDDRFQPLKLSRKAITEMS